ncbi:hypothetical protein GDO78_019739 [Eleutherodactylus coqui]|uniref:Uncharacterized protein n=1 Tax=Eleutherodactylus coqui TaxID=57060 RepID=A0A8J6EIQ9_ELECQ|nr:hypothetical protein GDO78_019739 [Eleutherodactylus coqui]
MHPSRLLDDILLTCRPSYNCKPHLLQKMRPGMCSHQSHGTTPKPFLKVRFLMPHRHATTLVQKYGESWFNHQSRI